MTIDVRSNFGKVTVSTGYDASATSIALSSGHGSKLPSSFSYNLVWYNSTDYPDPADDPNVEIVRVTNRVTDTLTVTRAQEGTSATTKNTGSKTYKMALAVTKKMIDDIETDIAAAAVSEFADGGEAGGAARSLGNTDNFDLGILTNNLTRIFVDNAGNVGIGVTGASVTDLLTLGAGNMVVGAGQGMHAASTHFVVGGDDIFFTTNDFLTTYAKFTEEKNFLFNTTTQDATAVGVIHIANGTAPGSSPANMVQLYAQDVASSSELKVRDEASNITTLSPHNFTLFDPDPSYELPWSYYSRNEHIGKEINVDMFGAIRAIEQLTGKQFIYIRDLPANEKKAWAEAQADKIAQKLEDDIFMETLKLREVPKAEAVEEVDEMEEFTGNRTRKVYSLDEKTGNISFRLVPVKEQRPTGKMVKKLKDGVKLDTNTGKFFRKTTRTEAEAITIAQPAKQPPQWLKDRGV